MIHLLRDYQTKLVLDIERSHRPLVAAPTGSGKTVVAAELIRRAPNWHVLFLAHRRELIYQPQAKLKEFGIEAGIILAGHPRDPMRRVQLASIQTLASRSIRRGEELPPANLVIIDEAHHAPAATYQAIVERHPEAKIVGLTATACRRDGRGLGSVFDRLVLAPQVQELIELGYLVPTKVYAPSIPDLTGVRTRHGDYVEAQLAAIMDRAELVGDIVTHWHRLAQRRKTVVFATSVEHSIHLAEEFKKCGVKAEHIDGSTPKDERDEILAMLSEGALDLVANCMVLTEGWDQPDVACCVLARPTKSLGLYRQMVGRVLRPYPGKDHALILDHAGATYAHGFAEDDIEWTLEPDRKAKNIKDQQSGCKPSDRLIECSNCGAIRNRGRPCDHCGFMPSRPGAYVPTRDGELHHVERNGKVNRQEDSPARKRQWYAMLRGEGAARGYKSGWAAVNFKDKFNEWPPPHWNNDELVQPDPEVRAWIRHKLIRYAYSQRRAAEQAQVAADG